MVTYGTNGPVAIPRIIAIAKRLYPLQAILSSINALIDENILLVMGCHWVVSFDPDQTPRQWKKEILQREGHLIKCIPAWYPSIYNEGWFVNNEGPVLSRDVLQPGKYYVYDTLVAYVVPDGLPRHLSDEKLTEPYPVAQEVLKQLRRG